MVKHEVVSPDEGSSESCLHCEINDLIQEHVKGLTENSPWFDQPRAVGDPDVARVIAPSSTRMPKWCSLSMELPAGRAEGPSFSRQRDCRRPAK